MSENDISQTPQLEKINVYLNHILFAQEITWYKLEKYGQHHFEFLYSLDFVFCLFIRTNRICNLSFVREERRHIFIHFRLDYISKRLSLLKFRKKLFSQFHNRKSKPGIGLSWNVSSQGRRSAIHSLSMWTLQLISTLIEKKRWKDVHINNCSIQELGSV